jgi:hypothetical protein
MRFEVRTDVEGDEPYAVVAVGGEGVIGWYVTREIAEEVVAEAETKAPKGWTGYPLPAALVASVFHLPGQHDQRSHGHRKHLPPDAPLQVGFPSSTAADAAALWHRDLRDLSDLISGVDSGALSADQVADGKLGTVVKVQLGNGVDAIQKKTRDSALATAVQGADAEQLVSALGRSIGAPVPRTLRTQPDTVTQEYVAGQTGAQLMDRLLRENKSDSPGFRAPGPERDVTARILTGMIDSPEGRRLGALDLLTANWTRADPSNWLMDDRGRPVGVDHQLAFQDDVTHEDPARVPLGVNVPPFSSHYAHDGEWQPNDLTQADVDWLRARMDDLRPDFAVLGRQDWWLFASKRLDVLADHASGTTNLFAPTTAAASPDHLLPPIRPSRGRYRAAVGHAQTFHLPGEHDQRSHGHRKLHVGDPVSAPGHPQGELADHVSKWHRDLTDLGSLMEAVDSGYGHEDIHDLAGGVSAEAVYRIDYANGAKGVAKRMRISGSTAQPDAEQLYATMGRLLGAPVPRALRTQDDEVVFDFIPGRSGADVRGKMNGSQWEDRLRQTPVATRARLGLLDLLSANNDRNGGNLLFDENGQTVIAGIDHANAHSGNDTDPTRPYTFSNHTIGMDLFQRTLSSGTLSWVDNPLTQADVAWVRTRLVDLEDDFATLERQKWWAFAMDRFDQIAKRASGKPGQNLFAPVTAAAVFHLPGQHDQRTHGRRHLQSGTDLFEHGDVSGSVADKAALWHRDLSDLHGIIASIESGEVDHEPLSGGKMGTVEAILNGDGSTLVVKIMNDVTTIMGPGFDPDRQADAEQLASILGRAIGAPVPRVLRTDVDEVYMEHVDGQSAAELYGQIGEGLSDAEAKAFHDSVNARIGDQVDTVAGLRLGLLDVMIGNWDRANPSNWKATPDGPVGLDHAVAWSDGSEAIDPPGHDAIGPFALHFVDLVPGDSRWSAGTDWAKNELSPEDVDWLRKRLADVEDDFVVVGRHDWWEFARDRLEAVAEHARGTESRFATNE